jgi:hypothetical protein
VYLFGTSVCSARSFYIATPDSSQCHTRSHLTSIFHHSLVFASAHNRLLASCTRQFFLYLHISSQIMYLIDVTLSISMHCSTYRFANAGGQYLGNESPREFGELPTRDSGHSISLHSSPENKISSKTNIDTRAFAVPSKNSKELPVRRLWARNP